MEISSGVRHALPENGGNGYDGYSMSNNARTAYQNGEKPLSRWSKEDILAIIKRDYPEAYDIARSMTLKELRNKLLRKSSWHHTLEQHIPSYYMTWRGQEFSEELRRRGYDGVIQSKSGDEIVAFDSNQIKLVTNKNPTGSSDIRFALPEDFVEGIETLDTSWYNEIQLNPSEQNRLQSEALTWDTRHRNELRWRTLSNGITYHYVIDNDGIVHCVGREKAQNIHERYDNYDNRNREQTDRFIEEFGLEQGGHSVGSSVDGNGREQTTADRHDNPSLPQKGRSDGTGYTQTGPYDNRRPQGRVQGQSPILKPVHRFKDLVGRTQTVLRVNGTSYMIEGDSPNVKYRPTIENTIPQKKAPDGGFFCLCL